MCLHVMKAAIDHDSFPGSFIAREGQVMYFYDDPISILRAYVEDGASMSVDDLLTREMEGLEEDGITSRSISFADRLKSIKAYGFWGFMTDTEIHVYAARTAPFSSVLVLLGHELGHAAMNENIWHSGIRNDEELWADSYGWVAREAAKLTSLIFKYFDDTQEV